MLMKQQKEINQIKLMKPQFGETVFFLNAELIKWQDNESL
jgi:hypothetical protein